MPNAVRAISSLTDMEPFPLVVNETPSGAMDGANSTFTLAAKPRPGTTQVYLNGLRQTLGEAYSESADTIVFSEPPHAGDDLIVDYIRDGA